MAQMPMELANRSAEHRIRLPAPNHKRGNHRRPRTNDASGEIGRYALTLHKTVIERTIRVVPRIVLRIDERYILVQLNAEVEPLDPSAHHISSADDDRLGQPVIDYLLHS